MPSGSLDFFRSDRYPVNQDLGIFITITNIDAGRSFDVKITIIPQQDGAVYGI